MFKNINQKGVISTSFFLLTFSITLSTLFTFLGLNLVFSLNGLSYDSYSELYNHLLKVPNLYSLTICLFVLIITFSQIFIVNYILKRAVRNKSDQEYSFTNLIGYLERNSLIIYIIGIILLICLYVVFSIINIGKGAPIFYYFVGLLLAAAISGVISVTSTGPYLTNKGSAPHLFTASFFAMFLGQIIINIILIAGSFLVAGIEITVFKWTHLNNNFFVYFMVYFPLLFIMYSYFQFWQGSFALKLYQKK